MKLELVYLKPFRDDVDSPFVFDVFQSIPERICAPTDDAGEKKHHRDIDPNLGVSLSPRSILTRPVYAIESQTGWTVVRGHQRMNTALAQGWESVPVIALPPDTDTETLVDISLRNRHTTLTGIESLVALFKTTVFSLETPEKIPIPIDSVPHLEFPNWIYPIHATLLGRKVSATFLLRLFETLTFTVEELKTIHESALSIEHFIPLLELTLQERQTLLQIRREIPLTAAELAKMSRLLAFARAKQDFDLREWADTIGSGGASGWRGSDLVRALRKQTHPVLSETEIEIAKTINLMRLCQRVKITAPENLEGDSFSCYLRFSRVEELQHHIDKLTREIGSGSVGRILELLNDIPPKRQTT